MRSPAEELTKEPIFDPDVDVEARAEPTAATDTPDIGKLGDAIEGSGELRTAALLGLFVLAVLYTLKAAAPLILPIVLAVLIDFLLTPIVRALKRLKIPEPVGAALVIVGLVGGIGYTAYRLASPAADWVARAPESVSRIERKLKTVSRPVEQVTAAADRVEQATDMDKVTPTVQVKGESLSRRLFGSTTAVIAGATFVIFLSYFLLAAGDLFLQKLIKVLPQFKDKKKAVSIARETEAQISSYLFYSTLINAGVGVATAALCWAFGVPNPVLWGLVAALLNYIPYVGAIATMAVLGLAALLTFENTAHALAVPAIFFVINMIEGNLITPTVLGRTMRLNTVAIFVGLTFWWYLWGITGAVLAVPMMAVMKIVCEHVEALAPVAEFLGD